MVPFKTVWVILALATCVAATDEDKPKPTIFFQETFSDGNGWVGRWVNSSFAEDVGAFNISRGTKFLDELEDLGLRTTEDLRHYAITARFDPFSNKDRDLIFQFSVKNEHSLRCGGTYFKILGCDFDQNDFGPDTQYLIMFGPDICGPENRKLQVILSKRGANHPLTKHLKYPLDKLTHLYTLIIRPDNTFEVMIDNRRAYQGLIDQAFGILPPMKIDDPEAKKPELWDDVEYIDDPNAKKPDDWVDERFVPDPDATKPADWNDAVDGEWEPPMIDNPVYQGPWSPPKIKNPNYDGPWTAPKIPNPAYVPDPELYAFPEICAVGLEVWQVEAGSIFDNILLTDDTEFARKQGEKIWRPRMERERQLTEEEEMIETDVGDEEDNIYKQESEEADAFRKLARGEPVSELMDEDKEEMLEDEDEDDEGEDEEGEEEEEEEEEEDDEEEEDEDEEEDDEDEEESDDEDEEDFDWGMEDGAKMDDEYEDQLVDPDFEAGTAENPRAHKEEL